MVVIGELFVILCSLNLLFSWFFVELVEEVEDFWWEEILDVKFRVSLDVLFLCILDDKMWFLDSGVFWIRIRDCIEYC